MAVEPLFVADMSTLKARIRMSGAPSSTDVQDLIEEAVRTVRAGFYREIAADRISTIKTITEDENPTTENGILRLLASTTELKWVRYELMRTVPTLFFDSAPAAQTAWNEEGMLRGTSNSEREAEMKRLWADIQAAIPLLEGETEITEESTIKIFVLEPEGGALRAGGSLWLQ